LILTGLTSGEGVGFSRAFLFLVNDERTHLHGRIAIGARSLSEAQDTWAKIRAYCDSKREVGQDALTCLLDVAESHSVALAKGELVDSTISQLTQQLKIPLTPQGGVLSACCIAKRPILLLDSQPDEFRSALAHITAQEESRPFVCVPLLSKDAVLGAIIVDNRFLPSERIIAQADINSLEAFAWVTAMTIENQRLREEKKWETWKQCAARVAHVIGGRLSVIKDNASKLAIHIAASPTLEFQDHRQSLAKVREGISKAEMVLRDFREFGAKSKLRMTRVDVAKLIRDVIAEMQTEKILVNLHIPVEPLYVTGNSVKLSDSLLQIIENAKEATLLAPKPLELTVTAVSIKNQTDTMKRVIKITIADNGPGVEIDKKKQIFEPLFTTKKATGNGLGLAIVRDVIQEHGGAIEESGSSGMGAIFQIYLPEAMLD
jgi:signal transduction histidine kinase